jgi:hypothetical protein
MIAGALVSSPAGENDPMIPHTLVLKPGLVIERPAPAESSA